MIITALSLVSFSVPALPQDDEALTTPGECALHAAVSDGEAWLNLRWRYELVDTDATTSLSTLRTVLGYKSASFSGFTGLVEFEDVSLFGFAHNEAEGGIADSKSTEVNRVHLDYSLDDDQTLSLGRQRIKRGNLRWISNVGWRQNEQTYDALSFSGSFGGVNLFLAGIENANTVLGADREMNSLLFDATGDVTDHIHFGAYVYDIDFDDTPDASTTTTGGYLNARYGTSMDIDWRLEFAQQKDSGDSTVELSESYLLADVGLGKGPWHAGISYEVLGGDGIASVQAPLATLHAWNGLADQFLVTPVSGLKDLSIDFGWEQGSWAANIALHDFKADELSGSYGEEVDVSVVHTCDSGAKVGVKYADYSADEFGSDVTKTWIWLGMSF